MPDPLRDVLAAAVEESRRRGYKTVVIALDDLDELLAHRGVTLTREPGLDEWRDHVPSGYEDMTGYGQVSCSCGWDSSDVLGWEQHIARAALASEDRP